MMHDSYEIRSGRRDRTHKFINTEVCTRKRYKIQIAVNEVVGKRRQMFRAYLLDYWFHQFEDPLVVTI